MPARTGRTTHQAEISEDLGPIIKGTPAERRQARLTVASSSRDADDARELLAALGLLDERAEGVA